MKLAAYGLTFILTLAIAAFLFVGMLVVLNGYSEAKAQPILIGYLIVAVLTLITSTWLAGRSLTMMGLRMKMQRFSFPAWLTMAVSVALTTIGAAVALMLASFALIALFPAK